MRFPSIIAILSLMSATPSLSARPMPFVKLTQKRLLANRDGTTPPSSSSPSVAVKSSVLLNKKLHHMKTKRPEPNLETTTPAPTPSNHTRNLETEDDPQTRVIDGDLTQPGEYPYYVNIGGTEFVCGGTLIAPRVVLSAAHCGDSFISEVRVGAYEAGWYSNDGSQKVAVADKWIHPGWDFFTVENDYMLLLLDEPVYIEDDVVVQLSESTADVEEGTSLTILGLGLKDEETQQLADTLLDETILAYSDEDCAEIYGAEGVPIYPDKMFCAGAPEGGTATCNGDSGGPIVKREGNVHIVTGIVSFGLASGCAQPGIPNVYARVSTAIEMIQSVVCDDWGQVDATFCYGGGGGGEETPEPSTEPPFTECLYEENAFYSCFADEEQMLQCVDCYLAYLPVFPTCGDVEELDCMVEQICPCSGCGSLIADWDTCLNEGVCDPIACPDTETPEPSTEPPVTGEGCVYEENAFYSCFADEEQMLQCVDCYAAFLPEFPTCGDIEELDCMVEQLCPSCYGCGSQIANFDTCLNEGICDPFNCSGYNRRHLRMGRK